MNDQREKAHRREHQPAAPEVFHAEKPNGFIGTTTECSYQPT